MGAEDGPELELLEQDLVEALLGKDKNVVCSVTCGGGGATKTNIKQGEMMCLNVHNIIACKITRRPQKISKK